MDLPVSAIGPNVFHNAVCVPAATENNARTNHRLLYTTNSVFFLGSGISWLMAP